MDRVGRRAAGGVGGADAQGEPFYLHCGDVPSGVSRGSTA